MNTFLLTWNPNNYPTWESERHLAISSTDLDDINVTDWSCGNRTSGINDGDRVYMLRLGAEPRGVIASGVAVADEEGGDAIFQDAHWDGTPGKTANFVMVEFDRVLDDTELLPLGDLHEAFPGENPKTWSPQGSGTKVPDELVDGLETLWTQWTEGVVRTSGGRGDRRRARESGAPVDARVREAIEARAMAAAIDFYTKLGISVKDVSAYRAWDLEFKSGGDDDGDTHRVIVKASTGDAQQVDLTAAEVDAAQELYETDLIVLAGISWRFDGDSATATGGKVLRWEDWTPRQRDLTASRFTCGLLPADNDPRFLVLEDDDETES